MRDVLWGIFAIVTFVMGIIANGEDAQLAYDKIQGGEPFRNLGTYYQCIEVEAKFYPKEVTHEPAR